MSHLKDLNVKLQGENILDFITATRAFQKS